MTKSKLKIVERLFFQWKASNANNVTRSFGTSTDGYRPVTRWVQNEIVKSLRFGNKDRAFNLLDEIVSTNQAMEAKHFISIFWFCARAPDPLFAKETFNLMMEKGIKLNDQCRFLVIKSLCEGGNLEEAFSFLSNVRSKSNENGNDDVILSLSAYNIVLKACFRADKPNYFANCLHLMDDSWLGKNKLTYAYLLDDAQAKKDSTMIYAIWNDYHGCYNMSIKILRKFIHSFMKIRDLGAALRTLQQMLDLVYQHKFGTSQFEHERLFDSSLDVPIPLQNQDAWDKYNQDNYNGIPSPFLYSEDGDLNEKVKFDLEATVLRLSKKPLPGSVKDVLRKSFVDVIWTCAGTKNPVLAEHLLLLMQNLGFEPSNWEYDGVIRAWSYSHDFRRGIEVLDIMRKKNMNPRDSTLAALSVSCSEAFELDMAVSFLNQMSHCHFAYPFNAFLKACAKLDRPELAVRALARMKTLRVKPDIRTFECMFSLFCNVNTPYEDGNLWSQADVDKRVKAIEMDMTKHEINHSRRSLQNMLRAIGTEGMLEKLEQHLAHAENRDLPKMGNEAIHIYNTVLSALVKNKSSRKAIEIFKKMIECGLSLNRVTYSIMIDCCNKLNCYRSALAVTCMMIRHFYHPSTVDYTSLIKILLHCNDFDRALKLIDQAGSEGRPRDVVMYNTVLREASENGRIDVIELIVEMMRRERIKPDPSTCSYVLSAYADNGFDSTAMEALQVLSVRMISEEEDVPEEKRIEYENLIFSEEPEAESRIVEIFKDSAFLCIALLNLRWCATCGLTISWSPNQSPWVKSLASDYDSSSRG